jgi:thiamine pyrophosphokinase
VTDPSRDALVVGRSGHALVLGDGGATTTRGGLETAWPGWADGVSVVAAADGGARLAEKLGIRLQLWVGDGDSWPEAEIECLAAEGVAVRRVPMAKDESDLELAVAAVAAVGAEGQTGGIGRITILGAIGGPRVDHELANVALLAHPALSGLDVRLLDDRTRIRLLDGHARGGQPVTGDLHGRPGDIVSLLPLGGTVAGITTRGLAYPLEDEPLDIGPARGLSNVRVGPHALVTIRSGRLLIVETPATVGR